MDRFSWSDGILRDDEQLVCQQNGVRLYDGNDKARTKKSVGKRLEYG